MAALPEVFRMPVGQVGIVPFDAERLKRSHILRERPRATEREWRSLICSMVNMTDAFFGTRHHCFGLVPDCRTP